MEKKTFILMIGLLSLGLICGVSITANYYQNLFKEKTTVAENYEVSKISMGDFDGYWTVEVYSRNNNTNDTFYIDNENPGNFEDLGVEPGRTYNFVLNSKHDNKGIISINRVEGI